MAASPVKNTNDKTRPGRATILIVDDDSATRTTLGQVFEDAGLRVITATNAPAALRLLHKEHCDLVMLDIDLPGVDGFALCRLLRAQPAMKQLPVVVFSSSDAESSKVEAFAAGADDYITKPSTPPELLSRINSHLSAAQREWALLGSNRELRFLADLGRGLLRALEPGQVALRVAGATYEATGAALCAAIVDSSGKKTVCVFDREGSAEGISLIHEDRFSEWLESGSAAVADRSLDAGKFLLQDNLHTVEYVSPIRFGGRTKGALLVAFDSVDDCGETECRLVDAAAQQAALASQISTLYLAARESAVSLAEEVDRRTAAGEVQQRFTEAIIDNLPISLYAVDREFRIVAWNRNRESGELGIPRGAALGRNIFEVLTRQRREVLEQEFARVFETGEIERIEQDTVAPDGETKHWLISKIPMRAEGSDKVTHVITVGEEITGRVKADRAVARAEKLAAVGRLAAGIVHEINNPLATIAACAEALGSRVEEGAFDASGEVDNLREYLGLIRDEAFRCKTITNGLLDFSRTRAGRHTIVNVTDVVNATARLVTHQHRGDKIDIVVQASEDSVMVSGDEGHLQQAVVALATNAIDAMPGGGRLTFRTRAKASNVLIEVSDTGVGIPTENLTKIFDPFFTTKEVGRGTGLGLAVCYGILTEHGGRLEVQSAEGVGTTFTITLPARNDGDQIS
ncbi:MAG: response regulator [Pyrinomonadaceae bacterium]